MLDKNYFLKDIYWSLKYSMETGTTPVVYTTTKCYDIKVKNKTKKGKI